MQDYPEGGIRVPDIEAFAQALQVRRIRRVLEPHSGLHTNFLLYWLHQFYGHLRQGKRLLMSTCDFLQFDPNKEKISPRLWRYTLKSLGTMHGPIPNTEQKGKHPLVQYKHLGRTATTARTHAQWPLSQYRP